MCMNNPFQSVYDSAFDINKYVYHYTSHEALCQILLSNSFKLSNPNRTNDMREKKSGVRFTNKSDDDSDECNTVVSHILQHTRFISVSKDPAVTSPSPYPKDDDRYYTDKTFRGFAFEGMMAYYANNNTGGAIILGEKKFRTLINNSVKFKLVKARKITYKDRAQPYDMSYECIKDFCDGDADVKGIGAMTALEFYKNNKDYLLSKFFTKTSTWRDEHEFRYVIVTDSPDPCYINNIAECIEGIVVGENMEKEKINNLKLIVSEMNRKRITKEEIPVRRIIFDVDGTYLLEV